MMNQNNEERCGTTAPQTNPETKDRLQSTMIRQFQAAVAPAPRHSNDPVLPEVKVFIINAAPLTDRLRYRRIPLRELAKSRRLCRMKELEKEAADLRSQIKQSFEAYQRGDVRPVDEFMAELEAELNQADVSEPRL